MGWVSLCACIAIAKIPEKAGSIGCLIGEDKSLTGLGKSKGRSWQSKNGDEIGNRFCITALGI